LNKRMGVLIDTQEDFENKVKVKYGDKVEILSQYKGGSFPVDFVYHCEKHGDTHKTIHGKNITGKSFQPCQECDSEKKSKNSTRGFPKEYYYKKIKDYCEFMGGDLITKEWTRAKDTYEIDCGNPEHPNFFTTADSLVNKPQWCPYCYGRRGNFEEEIVEIIESKNGKLLSPYIHSNGQVKVICNEHNYIWDIMPLNLKKGKWCPICSLPYSEKVVYDYLIDQGCIVISQYTFSDLVGYNNELLKFDFAILDKEFNLIQLIEVDDDSHRYNLTTPDKVLVQERDIIKNDYCNLNNIALYRLEYRSGAKQDKINFKNREWYYKYIKANLLKILIIKDDINKENLA